MRTRGARTLQQVKNRLHFDLRPADGTRDEEVARLLVDSGRPRGSTTTGRSAATRLGWMVLADPEGNEFCVLRSDAERACRRHLVDWAGTPSNPGPGV